MISSPRFNLNRAYSFIVEARTLLATGVLNEDGSLHPDVEDNGSRIGDLLDETRFWGDIPNGVSTDAMWQLEDMVAVELSDIDADVLAAMDELMSDIQGDIERRIA